MSVFLRMLLALICGGAIGLEREFKRRPAGFRTHILICLGAAMTTLTSQYLFLVMNYPTDIARLGAQVIAGIGFIGAGTIIVTKRQRVKGLTTAAGLWTSAIVGLALGGGFYEGAILATVLILLAELLFSRLEYHILSTSPEINIYLEYSSHEALDRLLKLLKRRNVSIIGMELTRSVESETKNSCVIFSLRLNKKLRPTEIIEEINNCEGVLLVQEL
ncbi:MAG: MgtC/SapB family protein [Oscillospiraceae bacterium]|nr:MgtC/SapB family protein [Oscillospiraceae bacterium]